VRPLRIALNAMAAVTGGGVTYWLQILPELAALGAPHEYLLLVGGHQGTLGEGLPAAFTTRRIVVGRPRGPRRALWEQTRLPRVLREWRADVLLAPNDMAPLRSPCPVVLGIRNSNPYYGPRGSTWKERLRERAIRRLTTLSAARAREVFFVSEDSRRRIGPMLGLPEAKSRVIYHGIAPIFLDRTGAPGGSAFPVPARPYILSVSAVRIHKDFGTLFRAFAALRKDSPLAATMELRIAGAVIDRAYYDSLQQTIAELGLKGAVVFAGEVPYADLPGLYRAARAFVLPSQAETFGHPLVESMASGLPVVTTDLGVTREICGDAAVYFEPGSADSLLTALKSVVSEGPERARLVEAGPRRARRFSWRQAAAQTLATLEEAAAERTT
jgi:glycosyltransferase involved in cell wall biosynthesis